MPAERGFAYNEPAAETEPGPLWWTAGTVLPLPHPWIGPPVEAQPRSLMLAQVLNLWLRLWEAKGDILLYSALWLGVLGLSARQETLSSGGRKTEHGSICVLPVI